MGVRLLLLNPRFPESFWSFKWAVEEILPGKRAINPPLGLATLAALCPADWDVTVVDENIEPVPLRPRADVIGVCGMGIQFRRQRDLLEFYRRRGYFVVAGGSYASLSPEKYRSLADVVVAGEAELLWPQFCRDFANGSPAPLYRATSPVALADSPTPRFDLLKLDRYSTATLQFSRGCPFRCEFCDIIVMFGRKPRWKSIDQVRRELDALREHGVQNVFFVDDNLIGNKRAARELLRFLKAYQEQHRYRFRFGTEASLNLAQDRELLELFRAANFTWIFIGIESPDRETLAQTRKTQNNHEDALTALRRIYSYGIDVLGGFIVGFDGDDLATFERQYRFVMESGIEVAMIGLLTALPHTPLHERLQRAGRLLEEADGLDNTKPATNVVPTHMRYEEMVDAYMALYRRLLTDHGIAQRIRNKLRHLVRPVYAGEYSLKQQLGILGRLLAKGIVPGGPRRWFHFLRSLPWLHPDGMPLAIVDWIAGLAMRDYAERHFTAAPAREERLIEEIYRSIEKKLRSYAGAGRVQLALRPNHATVPDLCIDLNGWLDPRLLARALRCVEKMLKRTRSRVILGIGEVQQQHVRRLNQSLRRLARYGDRVFIAASDTLREHAAIDWSRFHLILDLPERAHSALRWERQT